jgi:membrane fusion protein, copper/silver efflux system
MIDRNLEIKKRKKAVVTGLILVLIAIGSLFAWHYGQSFFGGKTTAGGPKILFYRNPMDPTITSPVPAKDWMGMDYIPVYAEGTAPKVKSPEQEAEDFFAEETGGTSKTVKGLAPITLSEQAVRVAGVITTPAVKDRFQRAVRTVGRVVPDETRVRSVQTKAGGWVETLNIDFTGQRVNAGDPIFSLYSPMLVSGQEEFLQARQSAAELTKSKDPEIRKTGEMLLSAARKRLERFDVPKSFIDILAATGKVERDVPIITPLSGFVTLKEVLIGQRIEPGMTLFTVADLSTVWVEAEFYETDAESLKIGFEAKLSAPFSPNLTQTGRITFIYPFLSAESRTVKARIEFPNNSLTLKPGMFVDIDLLIDLGESVLIPDSAVMDSGPRKIVFIQTGKTGFTPREVRIGAISRGRAQILSGLEAGENVVVQANFLLDSESRLQAIVEEALQKKADSGSGSAP